MGFNQAIPPFAICCAGGSHSDGYFHQVYKIAPDTLLWLNGGLLKLTAWSHARNDGGESTRAAYLLLRADCQGNKALVRQWTWKAL
jgi:hypothetical protein